MSLISIIKLILLPLSKQSIKSQKALQTLQPKIEEIKKKYANKKEEMSRAMMAMYKENKVNPFSSCLPLIIQLPFLYAVFHVFREGFTNGCQSDATNTNPTSKYKVSQYILILLLVIYITLLLIKKIKT